MTDPADLPQAIAHAINDAVNSIIAQYESGFVTKWLCLIESVGEDGRRGLWPLASDDLKRWESKGMLAYALELDTIKGLKEAMTGDQ